MNEEAVFDNPLASRYASREMAGLWSLQRKFSTWRRLWLALAEAEAELGLTAEDGRTPRIRPQQLEEMRAHLDDLDFERAADYERRFRHDVMAHIHTFADKCPGARDIIHLGATSCYVTDNTDLILMRDGLELLRGKLAAVIDELGKFAERWKDLPTLGFTHFQPAQLTTVGKRASLWCFDFVLDFNEIDRRIATFPFRGVKGTTGTQASFLALFRGDENKVKRLDCLVTQKMGFEESLPITGQTYTRKIDSWVLDLLSGTGQSAHKYGTDLRLLAHRQEIDEPFEEEQVGSSAMAYKRNPMRAERMCGLSRYLMSLPANAAQTAANQWLERTLDDSANRRLVLPQAFLAADAVLRLALNISRGLLVHPELITRNVDHMIPYMATEDILMEAVAKGGDRQRLHECIRVHSQQVTEQLKATGGRNDLVERLQADPAFARVRFEEKLRPAAYTGRSSNQVKEFLHDYVEPIRRRFGTNQSEKAEIQV
jgi:adenylosuccinate lyase